MIEIILGMRIKELEGNERGSALKKKINRNAEAGQGKEGPLVLGWTFFSTEFNLPSFQEIKI